MSQPHSAPARRPLPGQQPRRVDFRCHVREHPLDTLESVDRLAELLPFPRVLDRQLERALGKPEDLPGAILFLASEDAEFITGQTLSVSGGLTMHG